MNLKQAAYTLGRFHNKYIIIDIFGFADYRSFAKKLLSTSSHNLKSLLIKNFNILSDCIEEDSIVQLTSFSQLHYPKILLHKKLYLNSQFNEKIVKGFLQVQSLIGSKLNMHNFEYHTNEFKDLNLLTQVLQTFNIKELTLQGSLLIDPDLIPFSVVKLEIGSWIKFK